MFMIARITALFIGRLKNVWVAFDKHIDTPNCLCSTSHCSIPAYRTDEGKPWVLPVVNAVECHMASDRMLNHEYLPVAGMPDFCSSACKLVLGKESKAICENRVCFVVVFGANPACTLTQRYMDVCLFSMCMQNYYSFFYHRQFLSCINDVI